MLFLRLYMLNFDLRSIFKVKVKNMADNQYFISLKINYTDCRNRKAMTPH